jgi:threonine dehydrogenase-like Zn-dependent dehydrogenase
MNTALQVWDGELSVITTPPPRVSVPTDVVIKVAYSGICGTDLHVLAKEFPSARSVVLADTSSVGLSRKLEAR